MAGDELKLKFNSPTKDSRTPDILVQPVYGTIYTTSTKKNAEHGGFSFGDTNVGLIVSNPDLRPRGQDAGRHLTGSVRKGALRSFRFFPKDRGEDNN
jgi:hypothetical protein